MAVQSTSTTVLYDPNLYDGLLTQLGGSSAAMRRNTYTAGNGVAILYVDDAYTSTDIEAIPLQITLDLSTATGDDDNCYPGTTVPCVTLATAVGKLYSTDST